MFNLSRPDRKPDFTYSIHEFWWEEMVSYCGNRDKYDKLIDIDGVIHYIWLNRGVETPDELIDSIQVGYRAFINKKVEEILLGSETESKLD
jgi:hypothetical protein